MIFISELSPNFHFENIASILFINEMNLLMRIFKKNIRIIIQKFSSSSITHNNNYDNRYLHISSLCLESGWNYETSVEM